MTTNVDIPVGTTVYLNWYNFQKQTEHTCKGVVVDNELWAGTKQADMLNVRFLVPGMPAPICHHFPADKLSLTPDNVPHDDCSGMWQKSRGSVVRRASATSASSPSDAWQAVQQFKQSHWDNEHNHLCIDALEEFYQLWRASIAAKHGVTIEDSSALSGFPAEVSIVDVDPGSPDGDRSSTYIVDTETGEIVPYADVPQQPQPKQIEHRPIVSEERYQELKQKMAVKLSRKQLRSTGRIEYTDSIQTSFFD